MAAEHICERRVADLYERETEVFHLRRPRSAELLARASRHMPNGVPCAWMDGLYFHRPVYASDGLGAHFRDVDGHCYLDMNQADLSMNGGYGVPAMVEAVRNRVARGTQFLLPVEDAIAVSELLSERYRHPFWQYTLSASAANVEALRIARAYTGKDQLLVFNGKYHGHIDATMAGAEHRSLGFTRDSSCNTRIVEFNDLAAVEHVLKAGNIACVLTEPALTNCGVIQPEPGFLAGLQSLCRQYSCLLIIDETHTQVCAFGGLTRAWNIGGDLITLGKTVAGGIPMGAYGMTQELGEFVAAHLEAENSADPRSAGGGLALGGTLYGNALSLAAAKVALTEIMIAPAYENTTRLGLQLSRGLQQAFDRHELPWRAQQLFNRSGYTFGPRHPTNASEYTRFHDPLLYNTMRVYYANRGVWESISSAGPAVSFPMTSADVECYLGVVDEFLGELTA